MQVYTEFLEFIKVDQGGWAFSYQAALPTCFWAADTTAAFKIKLKTFLFSKVHS